MANTKNQRWAVLIAEFGADIHYREGKNNIRADMFSRLHCPQINPVEVKNYVEPQQGTVTWFLLLYCDGVYKEQLIKAKRTAFTVEWQSAGYFDNEDHGFQDRVLLHQMLRTPPSPISQYIATSTMAD